MRNTIRVLLMVLLCTGASSWAQTLVSSLSELQAHLGDSNAHIVMMPGAYRIAPSDVTSGQFPDAALLTVSGTNSLFDFTGVTIEVDTDVFRSFAIGAHPILAEWRTAPLHRCRIAVFRGLGLRLAGTGNSEQSSLPRSIEYFRLRALRIPFS